MKVVAAAILASVAAGDLSLTWSDCGGGSTHAKITSFTPSTLILGQKTIMTGTGALDESVSGATFDLSMTGAIGQLLSCTGDASAAKTCNLPLGTGTLTFEAMSFPLSAGDIPVNVDISLAASLPASLQTTTTTCKATASNGDNLFCIEIKSAPAADVHPERAAQIAELKAMPGMTWTPVAHPKFASRKPGASKDFNGVKGDQREILDAAIARGEIVEYLADENFVAPESFDSEENWPQCAKTIGDIRDQSNCGCCWAFGGTEAASDRMCIATNATLLLPLSAQDICFNSNFDGCGGGQISTPWSYIKSTGVVTGSQQQPDDGKTDPFKGMGFCSKFSLPHCHHHGPTHGDPYPAEGAAGCPSESSPRGPTACDSDAKAPHNDFRSDKYTFSGQTISPNGESSLQQAISEGGPVEVAFTVYSDFENYGGGIYQHKSGGMAGGHAVKMVGWGVENGVKYWKVANSWDPYWGEKGYFRIIRGQNEGGIESQATASAANAKWSKKSTNVVV
jgi:cathepsin B